MSEPTEPTPDSRSVVIIGPTHPYKGGVAQHTTELAHRLHTAGHDVELVSWSAQYPARLYPGEQRLAAPEGPAYPRTSYPLAWNRPDSWLRVGRRVGRDAVDLLALVVVTPVQIPAYLAILAALRRTSHERTRIVAVCHNVLPHENRAADRVLTATFLRRLDGVLVHSEEQAALARTLTGAPVEVAELPPHLFTNVGTGATRGDGGQLRLLFFGFVRPYKGLDVLLHALARVDGVRLTVAGEFWGDPQPVRALIDQLGLSERVDLQLGYVAAQRVPALFCSADALVLPYLSGTATQNVWLAFEHGLPVVASRVGTMPEAIRDGEDGLLVPPGDVAALAAALNTLREGGTLAALRAGVTRVDPAPRWSSYTSALIGLAYPRPEGDQMTAAAPPGGRLLAITKRVAERVLWTRVAVRAGAERALLPAARRPIPDSVPASAVLRSRAEWQAAVRETRRLRLPRHHDQEKNWDALGAVGAVLREVGDDARVLDAGSARYSCVLPWLRLYGLRSLVGINLEFDRETRRGPVTFRYGDVTATGFPAGSFDAITCMSVIEHGVPVPDFLAECARLLRSGGILSVSTDYDHEPPDTSGKQMYGVPVRIFGPEDIRELIDRAAQNGLDLIGDLGDAALEHEERPVHWKRMGLDYTFILLTFRRRVAA